MSEAKKSGISRRGFASMDPERQRELARKGGSSVAPENRGFARNKAAAIEAGRKGGLAAAANRCRNV